MTPPAQRGERPKLRLGRASLAAKLSIAFLGLVAFVLIVNGALDTFLTYGQAKRAALEVESEKARAAAERVGVFLDEIQTELGWTAGVEWGYAKPEQQRYDFVRLLRQAPAITALSFIDGKGREQLAVSRLEPDVVASGKDFAADPRFLRAVADKIWFGPVEFRRGSEPYMTVALAHVGKTPGVTVADVNLKLVWDVVSAIHVGDKGFAYVVDDKGRLIAHPDLSLVLRDTDFSALPQVGAALAGRGNSEAEVARSLDGSGVLTAHAFAPKTHWTVFVEQPLAEALATAYRSLARSAALLGLGLTLAAVSGVALARRMAAPIRLLQAGAEKLGAGDLAQRLDIRTGDEIEALAGGFNRMAEQLQESYENLEGKVEARTKDLNEALSQQTATSEILRAIAASPGVVQPVLDRLVHTVCSLCDASDAVIMLRDGDELWTPAHRGPIPTPPNAGRRPISRDWPPGRAVIDGQTVHVHDLAQARDEYPLAVSISAGVARDAPQHASGAALAWRTALVAPLMREGAALGAIVLRRVEAAPFSQAQIALLQTFADQAVIAVENARLFAEVQARTLELTGSLKRQTATSEILRVISESPTDPSPVLDAIVLTGQRLFNCRAAGMVMVDGLKLKNITGAVGGRVLRPEELSPALPIDPAHNYPSRAFTTRRTQRFDFTDADAPEQERRIGELYGVLSGLFLPLVRGVDCVGVFGLLSDRSDAFDAKDIALAESFRDQAVIALENARLFNETKEALDRQIATAEILKVIASSTNDAAPVFEAIVASAKRLLGGRLSLLTRFVDDIAHLAAFTPVSPESDAAITAAFPRLSDDPVAVALRAGQTALIKDTETEDHWGWREGGRQTGFRSAANVPLVSQGVTIGGLTVNSAEPNAFDPDDVELLRTFADQAVIAIENVRLFNETKETLAQQTATAEVLKVISRSAFDLQVVFETLLTTALELVGGVGGGIALREGERLRFRAGTSPKGDLALGFVGRLIDIDPSSAAGRAVLSGRTEYIPDAAVDPDFHPVSSQSWGASYLGVPLSREGRTEGALTIIAERSHAFTPRHIELVEIFADQAVIAIGNTRLLEEVQSRTRELEQSLADLRKAQDRLVQSEKLASLGQLTAGIAHEIKNPLNFVNNFASLSRELLEELREALQRLPDDARADADDLMGMIDSNLEKVASHGKRADSIVKNMLLHSREGSGERASVNINAMVEEALNLGYHGARAEKPGFNVTVEKSLDPEAGDAELYLQEVTRVLLNLISNGFYAAAKRSQSEGPDYAPTLKAATRDLGHSVEIRIRDNGGGIPDEVRAKMFNPFFTTKPAGEGTGLGLSLSHDIVVKQHGGTLDVETAQGAFTEFVITLPRKGAGA